MAHGEYSAPSDAYLLARLRQLDPGRFEQFVADVWERLGWDTRVVGEPGDRGIDVIATGEHPDGRTEKQLVQVKRYGPKTTVGSPEVQQYASLRLQEDGVDTVTIVTTGTFSNQAEAMAPDLGVRLVDGEELLAICAEYDAWDVVAGYFDELDVVDGDAADVAPATDRGDGTDAVGTLAAAWRIYRRLRRLF